MIRRIWLLRLIEVLVVLALLADIWRFLTTANTTTDLVVDAVELVGLIAIGLICLYAERRLRQRPRKPS
jgi:hypothetical protein